MGKILVGKEIDKGGSVGGEHEKRIEIQGILQGARHWANAREDMGSCVGISEKQRHKVEISEPGAEREVEKLAMGSLIEEIKKRSIGRHKLSRGKAGQLV